MNKLNLKKGKKYRRRINLQKKFNEINIKMN